MPRSGRVVVCRYNSAEVPSWRSCRALQSIQPSAPDWAAPATNAGSSTAILRLSLEALAAGVDQPDNLPLLVHDLAGFSWSGHGSVLIYPRIVGWHVG
jgi:hypothetical protein